MPRVHFDEAWYAYAKFHSLYRGRFGMDVPEEMPNRPLIFAVQSTHKMLNGSAEPDQSKRSQPANSRIVENVSPARGVVRASGCRRVPGF